MGLFHIQGGQPLAGTVSVSGSKNAALSMIAAAILARGPLRLRNVPRVGDVRMLIRILRRLGVRADWQAPHVLELQVERLRPQAPIGSLVRRMRAGVCVLGPLLARCGSAALPLPGGCALGPRPIDLHLRGLAALGAQIEVRDGTILAHAPRLRGAAVDLSGPRGPTVTGTANVLCAATLALGKSIILGAAREPEIVELGRLLQALGADMAGLGTSTIEVTGSEGLGRADFAVMPDRIEAATFLLAGAVTRGSVSVRDAKAEHLQAVLGVLDQAGARMETRPGEIALHCPSTLRGMRITAQPFPGLPTDLQPQLTVVACLAEGSSRICDTVFPDRFSHVPQLLRMGAQVRRYGDGLLVRGPSRLHGARLAAADLRCAAALALAGLAANGKTSLSGLAHLDRGYEHFEEKLRALGANVQRVGGPQHIAASQRVLSPTERSRTG
jgi:UDP-N-acetylglucosamine 1-carboxyvinyltransferase